ncbi:LuxR C-terminal-related transcriptional regulator [Zhongshania sp.]|uniref:LuxR C-terminal-related transcriptional regulator n=1 Tax=Zhongshania sp. TaxID=1971902 RepID=UPI0039E3ED0D
MSAITRLASQYRLIESKLRPPFLRNAILYREQLTRSIMHEHSTSGVLTLIASAGSGKTTLMAQIFEESEKAGEQCFWLSLDSDDNEPAIFSKYILASSCDVGQNFEESESAFLDAGQSRNYEQFLDILLTRLVNVQLETAVFVDDFQFITNPTIIKFWNKLLQYSTPLLRIVIGSRNQLSLDLGRKKISGMITEVSQSDLNLSASEVTRYLREVHETDVPENAAVLLQSLTEGWIAGIQLAALAIGRDRVDAVSYIESFTGKDKILTEYLLQTVLRDLPLAVREFLLTTAPLTRFTAELCDHVCKRSNSREMLEYLNQSNLFIVPEDNVEHWYRYHHLFSDFLRSELRKSNLEKYDIICISAATWCESEDLLNEAVQYCLLAKDFNKAAGLITKRGPNLAQLSGDHSTVLDWMRRLPQEYHTSSPQLLLVHAWSSTFSRDPKLAVTLCRKVFAGIHDPDLYCWTLNKDQSDDAFWLAKSIEAIATVVSDKLSKSMMLCESIIEMAPPLQVLALATTYSVMAYACLGLREYQKSVNYAAEGYKYSIQAGSKFAAVWADFISGLANIELGRLHSALEDANRASATAGFEHVHNAYLRAMADFIHNEVNVQKCNFDVLQHRLKFTHTFTSLYGPAEPLLTSIRGDARHLFWDGQFDSARKILRNGQDLALSTNQFRLYFALLAEEIELQLRFDSIDSAKETIRRVNFYSSEHINLPIEFKPWIEETIAVIEIRVLMADGKVDEALERISNVIKSTVQTDDTRVRFLHKMRSLRALGLWRNGSAKEGVRELARVVDAAAPEDHAYEIVMAGSEILEMLKEIQPKRKNLLIDNELTVKYNFIERIISSINGDLDTPERKMGLGKSNIDVTKLLTGRELDILKLIVPGLDNNQIAGELQLSVATVKWHIHNIFQKIGVRSRTAAAAYGHNANLR